MSELRFKVNELVRNAMGQAVHRDKPDSVVFQKYERETHRLESEVIAALDQQAARIAALETALRGFLHHFTGDTISTCPLCLYGIESEYHLSDCPVEIARQALGEAE